MVVAVLGGGKGHGPIAQESAHRRRRGPPAHPASRSAAAHPASVAPVVITSSTSTARGGARDPVADGDRPPEGARPLPPAPAHLGLPSRRRGGAPAQPARPVRRATASASASAWLNPRPRARRGMEGHGHERRAAGQEALRRAGHHGRRHGRGHRQRCSELQRAHELPGRALVGHGGERGHAGGRRTARARRRASSPEQARQSGPARPAGPRQPQQSGGDEQRGEPEAHGPSLACREFPVGTPMPQSRACRVTKERRTPSSTGCRTRPCWRRWPSLAVIYIWRFRAARREAGGRGAGLAQAAAFAGAMLALLAALVSPIDRLGDDYLFSAHMVQHVLLGDIAPLLFLLSLSRVIMRPATRRLQRVERALGPFASPATGHRALARPHVPVAHPRPLRRGGGEPRPPRVSSTSASSPPAWRSGGR